MLRVGQQEDATAWVTQWREMGLLLTAVTHTRRLLHQTRPDRVRKPMVGDIRKQPLTG